MKRHLIGIGGVGMSALATALVRLGDEVTGADRTLGTPNIRFLEARGVKVFPDDGSGVDAATDEVIVSTAIEADNPGLVRAQERGIPVTHRARALARTLSDRRLVAVVGTCGKSTVTAMLGHVLAECGFDPFCVNGANVPGWEGAVRFGRGEFAVAEVDESDRSLTAFTPWAAVVTNASADHYSKEEMDEVFDAFIANLPGPCIDGRVTPWPLAPDELDDLAAGVPVPGRHNLQNAALAVAMAVRLGADPVAARRAMASFGGVERRLQRHSGASGSVVFDDYAHNPEKLRAMWTTLADRYPKGVCAVWRPHGYAPLRKMMEALAEMFAATLRPQDLLLVLPVYDAGGTADRSVSSADLVARLDGRVRTETVADLDAAFVRMDAVRGDFGCLVTCGARDPGLPGLARRLAAGG